jgi:hypothetical protein
MPWLIEHLTTTPISSWGNSEYKSCRGLHTLSTRWQNSGCWFQMKKLWPVEVDRTYKVWFFIWIDLKFLAVLTSVGLNGFQSSYSLCTCICVIMTMCRSYTFLTERKLLPNIDGICIVGGKVALILVVSSSGTTYANVVSIPAEEHNRYMTYNITYPRSGTHVFNVVWTALHTLQERIHVLCKWPQDIPRSPRPSCEVVASRTTDTQPLPHDRNYPQANLILRGPVRDSHHLVGGTYILTFSSVRRYRK